MSPARVLVDRLDALLTRDRLRVYPLALIGMFGLFWVLRTVSDPDGVLPDFRGRWTAGLLVANGRVHEIYSPVVQSAVQRADGADSLSWFVSPPPVAVFFTPLGALPYWLAVVLWLVVCVGTLTILARLLRPYWPAEWGSYTSVVLIAVASQPTLELVGAGQDSWLILLSGVAAWRLWRADRLFSAGLVVTLGTLVKPQLMFAAIVLVVIYGGVRMVGGLLLGTATCVIPTLFVLGPHVWAQWLKTVSSPMFIDQVTFGQAYKSVSLQGFAIALVPDKASRVAADLGLAAGLVLLACWVIWLVRRRPPEWALLSTASFVSVLAAPHAMVYDLVVLLPAVAVTVRRVPSPAVRVATAAGFLVAWLGSILSFVRTEPWPMSALSAQWAVLLTLMLMMLVMRADYLRMDKAAPVGQVRGRSRVHLAGGVADE